MTAEEKSVIASFLDLSGDYLRDGFAIDRAEYGFKDDLPLAYLVEEPEDENISGQIADSPEAINSEISSCRTCGLFSTRSKTVPGEGAVHPLVMVIGEGPGADEDREGKPFVGRAGQLLDKMLSSIGLSREKNCYIANIVKCRPPGNRDPSPEEITACIPFLERQIKMLRPLVILCAGRVAAQSLLKTSQGVNNLRMSFSQYNPDNGEPIPVLCTFHPSAVLRDDSLKRPAWEDLKLLRSRLILLDKEYASLSGES